MRNDKLYLGRDGGGTFARVYLRPFAALDRGREVLLIKQQPVEEIGEQPGEAQEP